MRKSNNRVAQTNIYTKNMKKSFFSIITLILAIALFSSCDKEEIISTDKLPAEITAYLSTHFPDNPVIQSMIERDDLTKTYEVILQGNYTLTFNRKKEVIDIEGFSKLPDSVIPAKIREYVGSNYPDNYIIGWELDGKNQQVELNNDLDLEFTMNGDFIRIDN